MPDYGNPSYWDERYSADEKTYDWYQDYSTLGKYISPYLKRVTDFEILIAGCGNSRLGAEIYDSGFVNVTNVDISTVVINQMSANCADREEMEFTVLDARNMEFIPDQCFDLIIDKALFDALLCSPNNLADMEALLKEMYRVLKNGGVYIIISHGGPDSRVGHIKRHIDVDIQAISIPKPAVKDIVEEGEAKYHFMYVCTKHTV